jgi:hypothetical protein
MCLITNLIIKAHDVFFNYYNKEINFRDYQFRINNSVTYNGKIITLIIDGTEQQVFTQAERTEFVFR